MLELLEGGELFDRIVRKSTYNEKEARDLVNTVLGAIKFCHDSDVVHRPALWLRVDFLSSYSYPFISSAFVLKDETHLLPRTLTPTWTRQIWTRRWRS